MVVTVVCICYNQASYLRESIGSVLRQTYKDLDLWLLDDGSTDDSPSVIRRIKSEYPFIHTRIDSANSGHNRIFNRYFPEYRGEAIIDLAADDILLPGRVASGVEALRDQTECGVHFTNAELIDSTGKHLDWHYPVDEQGKSTIRVPQGDVFAELLARYFINPVSMMIRRQVLEDLHGFDENLSYEDFDFWVRSARKYAYCYTDSVLVQKRIHSSNYSRIQYRHGSVQMRDTYRVCRKARSLVRNRDEQHAFTRRVGFEMRQCLRHGNLKLFFDYLKLL